MKSRLIFLFSVALIFLSAGVFSYSQEKPDAVNKNAKQNQEKKVTQTSKPHQVKTISLKSAKEKTADKNVVEKSGGVKTQKVVKKEIKKVDNAKVLQHHKKMEHKIQKKESKNASQKK